MQIMYFSITEKLHSFLHRQEFEENIDLGCKGEGEAGICLIWNKNHFFTSALLGIRIKIYKNVSNHLLLPVVVLEACDGSGLPHYIEGNTICPRSSYPFM